MKAVALAQRGSAKDFVDLYHMLRRTRHTFEDMFSRVQQKYQVDEKYNYHLKTAVVYFFDAEQEIDAIVIVDRAGRIRKISDGEWNKIKAFFVRFSQ